MPKPGHRLTRLNVHLLLGPHSLPSHAEKAKQKIIELRPHIYVPEYPEEEEKVERTEKMIEKGKSYVLPEELFAGFLKREAEIVAEHGLPVKILSILTHEIDKLIKERNKTVSAATGKFMSGDLETAMQLLVLGINQTVARDNFREQKLVEALKDFRRTLYLKALKRNPELRDAEELNVVMRLGTAHRSLAEKLKGVPGIHVTKTFLKPERDIVFGTRDELGERIKLKGLILDSTNPFHRLLLARALIESAIPKTFLQKNPELFFKHYDRLTPALRIISKSLSFEEIQQLCRQWSHGIRSALEAVLKPKRLIIPETLEDVNEILAHSSLAERFGLQKKFRGTPME